MAKFSTPEEVVRAYLEGEIPRGWVYDSLMVFITEDNVDEVIGGLPDEVRKHFARWAKMAYVGRTGDAPLLDGRPDPLPREALRAVQDWLRRNSPDAPS